MMPTPSKFPYGLLLLCGVSGTLMDLMNCLSLCRSTPLTAAAAKLG